MNATRRFKLITLLMMMMIVVVVVVVLYYPVYIFQSCSIVSCVQQKMESHLTQHRFLHRITESFHPAAAALFTQRPGDTSVSRSVAILRKLDVSYQI